MTYSYPKVILNDARKLQLVKKYLAKDDVIHKQSLSSYYNQFSKVYVHVKLNLIFWDFGMELT